MTGWLIAALASAALLGIAWVGYPAAMITIGERLRKPGAPSGDWTPLTSVVVATREPAAAVVARVQNLLRAEWPTERLEVIVAVDGPPGPYADALRTAAEDGVRVVAAAPPGGKAMALNAGVAAARGEVLVFTDTAQRFEPGTVAALVRPLADRGLGAVTGALHLGAEETAQSPVTAYWKLERRLRSAEASVHSPIGVTGAVWAMRKEHWQPLPAGLILDDLWTPMRLILHGHRVGVADQAVAHDDRRVDPRGEFARKARTLTGNFQLLAWMPDVLAPWRNPVWIQFVCHKVLRLLTPMALVAGGTGMVMLIATALDSPVAGVAILLGGLAAFGLLALAAGHLQARPIQAVWAVALLIGATFLAMWNAARGDWNVWRPGKHPNPAAPSGRGASRPPLR